MAKRDRFVEFERNKAIRRVEGLRKVLSDRKWDAESARNIERRINQYENLIAQSRTFVGGKRVEGHTKETTRAAAEAMRDLSRETGIYRQTRKLESFSETRSESRNMLFQTEMNIASEGGRPTVNIGGKTFEMTDAMVRMFYRAYQPLWNTGNVSVKERNRVILEKGDFRTLEEAFAVFMGTGDNAMRAQIVDKLQRSQNGFDVEFNDEEATALYEMLGEAQKRKSSPEPGIISSNTEQVATRQVSNTSEVLLTDKEKLQAIQNFLGDYFEKSDWGYLYDEDDEQ